MKKEKIKWVERKFIIMVAVELTIFKILISDMYLSALLLLTCFHAEYSGLVPVQQTFVRRDNFKH